MPEERLLLVVFHSLAFVVVYLVTRSTRNLALYSVKTTSSTKGLAMRKRVIVFGQRLLKWPVDYTPIKIIFAQKLMYRSSKIRRLTIWPVLGKCRNLLTDRYAQSSFCTAPEKRE